MLVQVGDVFARNNVDFRIPINVKVVKSCKLLLLLFGYFGEVFQYQFHNVINSFTSLLL